MQGLSETYALTGFHSSDHCRPPRQGDSKQQGTVDLLENKLRIL